MKKYPRSRIDIYLINLPNVTMCLPVHAIVSLCSTRWESYMHVECIAKSVPPPFRKVSKSKIRFPTCRTNGTWVPISKEYCQSLQQTWRLKLEKSDCTTDKQGCGNCLAVVFRPSAWNARAALPVLENSVVKLKNFSQPETVDNTDLHSTVIKVNYAIWVGPTWREERPTLPLYPHLQKVYCNTRTD